ncbi:MULTISPECIES: acetyl-CoA carboxylase, carboxyltransferase subunit beta [unclassified Dehalobacter]|uniref:acetyl-CoA carboxylase, carboxyltransferase subunit beta n=1 Tax=unclassified Dehalobacter TaxID=2635733 RepID=UPI0003877803|nr:MULTISPECIES: acetyl-CoA carboxylase, carboxyltransferase subunit beta [unclassified Dehalobacter]EQB20250.1 Acetyl-coenzyme A carboxyl transferase beta chain [Dehalobacter sp. UNSWDHB]RJE47588.1 acetyl-CoA carboxylase subunit beta [Dehalobacter sp. MCB1]TCX48598.1 acetyl-CoA carboxylase carboxyltransferase subunit beta [Dehalobacter sp. 14DCB1]TCX56352.1 acetyl-CoA carboxylase carboxyltransferase subunit beta [Dehalobacter sp. 12DCB1]
MFKLNRVFKKPRYLTIQQNNSQPVPAEIEGQREKSVLPAIPNGLWTKCPNCGETVYTKDLSNNHKVCVRCGYHFRMGAWERVELIMDTGTFKEINQDMKSVNPLDFNGYAEKISTGQEKTGLSEAVLTGYGKIHGQDAVIAVMDSNFMMGSMGSVVGEKVTRAFEFAAERKMPIIAFTASGGARMQEGMFSLMQMAKTSAAVGRHSRQGGLYIAVLTDPTTGGVTASFPMLGDIILAEPDALIGFAGKRVIQQTIRQELPEGFQKAEFLLEHGFIDKIVAREDLKLTLSRLIKLHYRR